MCREWIGLHCKTGSADPEEGQTSSADKDRQPLLGHLDDLKLFLSRHSVVQYGDKGQCMYVCACVFVCACVVIDR